jgi:CheY-like chemotaxis protein
MMAMQGPARDEAGLRILLIEDNPADVQLVELALREAEIAAEMEVISDGQCACDRIAGAAEGGGEQPDLVLLDLNLPRKNGVEVLRVLRGAWQFASTPVIVVSSTSRPAEIASVIEPGMTHFFRKPVTLAEFLRLGEMIRSVMASSRGQAGASEAGQSG